MTEITTQNICESDISTELALRQQGTAALTLAVASLAPCDVPAVSIASTRFIRLPELLARLGICRATIYLHIANGTFPKQISLGPRAVGWLESEVDAWLAARITARETQRK